MDKFLISEPELTAADGFGLYSTQHILVMLFAVVFIIVVRSYYKSLEQDKKYTFLKVVAWVLVFLECIKNVFYAYVGATQIDHLSLHLCGLNVFICLYHAYTKNEKSRELIYVFGLVGASAALIFPAWAHFPLFSFRALQSFSIHMILVLYSVLVIADHRPDYRNAKYIIYFLIVASVPIYFFNLQFGTNYMYLMGGTAGSPLKPMAEYLGVLYIPGLVLLVVIIVVIMYLPYYVSDKVREHKTVNVKG